MKKNIKLNAFTIFAFVLSAMLVTSCAKQPRVGDIEPSISDVIFDFSTKTRSTLMVKYDVPQNYKVYFEVYTQNPEELDADGQIVKKAIKPIDAGFTNDKGEYTYSISTPANIDKLYIYSPYAGVTRLMVADINEDGITEAKLPEGKQSSTTFSSGYKDATYNQIDGNLKRLGYWINDNSGYMLNGTNYTSYGRPDYLLLDKITISADILNLITQTLPEGGGVKPALIKNGDIHVTELANVDLYLLDDQTSANSTLAYYCYQTHNPPKNRNEIKDIIIAFPNSKVFKYNYYHPSGHNGAMERGEGIRLNYWEDGENMGAEFPKGVSIGWVIYNQSYAASINGNKLNATNGMFFADKNLNSNKRGHSALFRSGDKTIFGLEDWTGDYDYNDVVFYIKSNPISAITPDIPEIEPEKPSDDKASAIVAYNGILTFEDLWPSRGDFDMNDAVIKYESVVGYNTKNEVVQTEDKYTITHSGASISNSFAYQLDAQRNEIEVSFKSSLGNDGGAYIDQNLDKATIRLANDLLSYANLPNKATFEVFAKYTGRRISKDDFTKPPYNPFITTRQSDIEVHLTNIRPTEAIDKSLLGTKDDRSEPNRNLYYITYDEQQIQMPFAIDMIFEDSESASKFVIPKEGKRINMQYPKFLNWVNSNGKKDADWYLYPVE